MSLVEQARARMEEARTKIKTRVETVRGGGSSLGILGGNILGQGARLELPAIKEAKEKGVLKVLEEKLPRVKEMRQRGLLATFREKPILGGEKDKYSLRTEEKNETPPPTTTTTAYKLRA